jgi:hypothetical protein
MVDDVHQRLSTLPCPADEVVCQYENAVERCGRICEGRGHTARHAELRAFCVVVAASDGLATCLP